MALPQELSGENYLYTHRTTHRSSPMFDLHCHSFFEIYYIIRGKVQYLIEGKPYTPEPDSLLLISSNVFHGVRIDSDEPYERYAFHFLPELVSPEYRETLLMPFHSANIHLRDVQHSGLRDYCDSLLACASLPESLRAAAVKIRTEALLTQLYAVSDRQRALKNPSQKYDAQEIIDYLGAHLTEDISLEQLCETFFISKNHLNLIFRQATGTTVWNYLSHKRTALAQQLLLEGRPASEAAAAAGFRDYSTFYRCYRKIFSSSPTDAKQQNLFRRRT